MNDRRVKSEVDVREESTISRGGSKRAKQATSICTWPVDLDPITEDLTQVSTESRRYRSC